MKRDEIFFIIQNDVSNYIKQWDFDNNEKYENRIQSVEIKFKGNSEIATFKYEER